MAKEVSKHETWVAFQKYKLFFGYIQQLPPNPRRAFERALGLVRGA